MSWYNPNDWGHWADYVPGISAYRGFSKGDVGEGLAGLLPLPNVDTLGSDLKHTADNAYQQKREGYAAVQDKADQLKQERLARLQGVYGQADAKYDDTRRAMAALYGDPSTWRK